MPTGRTSSTESADLVGKSEEEADRDADQMKRIGNIWHEVCDKDNIRLAIRGAVKKPSDRFLLRHMEEYVEDIHAQLTTETYRFSPLKHMIAHDPKERVIDYAVTYPDKVLINCVLNVLKGGIIPKYIENTHSSIKGRGLHQCAGRIKRAVKRYPNAVALQTDIKKYYHSIDHDKCKAELRRYIKDAKCLRFLDTLIDNHDQGVPIGISLGSYIANLYLTRVDRWVYDELQPLMYVRYMDDMLMLFPTKGEAHVALDMLTEKLAEYGLMVKNNARICPVSMGVSMIGYVFYPTHTLLRKNIRERMRKKARAVRHLTGDAWKEQMASYYGWCVHADCRHLMQVMFGERYQLIKDMEYKKLNEKRTAENFFGLPRESRVSIRDLVGQDIVLLDYKEVVIHGERKSAVKYCTTEDDTPHLFLTRSEPIRDRLSRDIEYMPCVVTIVEKTTKGGRKYLIYE